MDAVCSPLNGLPRQLLTGFNQAAHVEAELVTPRGAKYWTKQSGGGINYCFAQEVYETVVRPALDEAVERGTPWWDGLVVERAKRLKVPIVGTRPSVVQHIGFDGANTARDLPFTILAKDYESDAYDREVYARFPQLAAAFGTSKRPTVPIVLMTHKRVENPQSGYAAMAIMAVR